MRNFIKIPMMLSFVTAVLVSCNRDNENQAFETAKIKTDSISVPQETMQVFAVQSIRTYSTYQQGCEGFYGYDYVRDGFTRIVTPYKFKTDAACGTSVSGTSQINFAPQEKGVYTFKFYNGENNWITKTITVE